MAPSATFTPDRLRAVVADHRRTHVAVAPYTRSSERLRDALGELAVDALARDVRERTLELLAAIDELDYTSDVLADAEHLPVNTLTSPVFDHDGRVAYAVALHVADPDLAVTRVDDARGGAAHRHGEDVHTSCVDRRGPAPSSSRSAHEHDHDPTTDRTARRARDVAPAFTLGSSVSGRRIGLRTDGAWRSWR